jgi:hypothetical protein
MPDDDLPSAPPPLDYATPPPPLRAGSSLAWARFAAGVTGVLVGSVSLAFAYRPPTPRDGVEPACLVIGFGIEIAVVAGVFRLGQSVRSRRARRPIAERGRLLTVMAGAGPTLAFAVAATVMDRPNGAGGGALCAAGVTYLIFVAISPWWVFNQGGGGGANEPPTAIA